jgi:hypothetical protein
LEESKVGLLYVLTEIVFLIVHNLTLETLLEQGSLLTSVQNIAIDSQISTSLYSLSARRDSRSKFKMYLIRDGLEKSTTSTAGTAENEAHFSWHEDAIETG